MGCFFFPFSDDCWYISHPNCANAAWPFFFDAHLSHSLIHILHVFSCSVVYTSVVAVFSIFRKHLATQSVKTNRKDLCRYISSISYISGQHVSFPCSSNPANLFWGELTQFGVNNMCNYILFIGFWFCSFLRQRTAHPFSLEFRLLERRKKKCGWHASVCQIVYGASQYVHNKTELFIFTNHIWKLQIRVLKWNRKPKLCVYIKAPSSNLIVEFLAVENKEYIE